MSTQCTPYPASVGAQVGRGALHSSPSKSIDSCAGVNVTEPSFVEGHVKRPFSSRLANRQKPWPSQYKILTRPPRRPRKAKMAPENGYVACHITILMYRATLCGGGGLRSARSSRFWIFPPHNNQMLSSSRRTASFGRKRGPRSPETPALSSARRIISTSAAT
jgi:hypothetical protein